MNVRARAGHNPGRWMAAATLLALPCLAVSASAAERIELANGFDLVCHHHVVVEGRVRVYMKAAETDYVELKPEAVAGFETVPDAPEKATPESAVDGAKQAGLAANTEGSKPKINETGPELHKARLAETRLTTSDLHQLLSHAGEEHNVDEDLLASVVKMESGGNARARSRAGARGLMQLMPGTAQQLGVTDSYAPEQNVRGGTAYLDGLLTRYRDNVALALAAYNAGPEAVDRYHGIPPYHETRVYVARVIHEFNRRVSARRSSHALASVESHRLGSE